ncbi:MAG: acyl-ACP--UDP-N-acetylglucosamine O-acyltransferase [Planctomycetota bacterium]
MPVIHPSAIVSPHAQLAQNVEIGPGCIVQASASAPVHLAPGVRLIANVILQGPLSIGENTTVYPNACLGLPAQDFKFSIGSPTAGVKIGAGCLIREGVTVHAATKPDIPTTIGDRVMMMVNSHAGHDAFVSNDVILANGALLAGHSHIGERANISGNCAIHQFNRVGRLAFVSGGVALSTDVPPFCVSAGRNRLHAVNLVGMRRNGLPREHITQVRWAFNQAFRRSLPRDEMLAKLLELGKDCPPVMEMHQFVLDAKRPISPGLGRPTRDLVSLVRAMRSGGPLEDSGGED